MDHDEPPYHGAYENGERDSHGHHHRRTPPKRRWMVSPLWIAIIFEGIAIAGLLIWGFSLEQDYNASAENEKTVLQKLKDAESEMAGLKHDLDEKDQSQQGSCLPKTVTLKLEEFLDVNKGYVKRAFFVTSGKKGSKVLEYKFILKNDTKANLTPKFNIVFFNAAGNEVGTAKFGYTEDGASSEKVLEKDEVRTVDGTFDLSNIPQPVLFMVKTLND